MMIDIISAILWITAITIGGYIANEEAKSRSLRQHMKEIGNDIPDGLQPIDVRKKTIAQLFSTERGSHEIARSIGSQLPAGLTVESSEDRQRRLENERYVRDERGF